MRADIGAIIELRLFSAAAEDRCCGEASAQGGRDADSLWTTTRSAEPRRIRSSFGSEEQASVGGAAAASDVVLKGA